MIAEKFSRSSKGTSFWLGRIGFWLAVIIAVVAVLAGPAYRYNLISLSSAFQGITVGAFGGIVSGLLCLAALWLTRNVINGASFRLAAVGLMLSIATAGIPWSLYLKAQSLPKIHDITTDTQNPPTFEALKEIRQASHNGAEYGGPEIAAQQLKAYPDIEPIVLQVTPKEALIKATAAATKMGWDIAALSAEKMKIEATDITNWFGFKDDIIIRITPDAGGSRVDVRSVSRIGLSDLGANADRIRAFAERLKTQ